MLTVLEILFIVLVVIVARELIDRTFGRRS